VIDGEKHTALEFHAAMSFSIASTLESTRILLNSTTPEFSSGLANSSGQLGHNLMDHTWAAERAAAFPARDKITFGRRPNGITYPAFRNVKASIPIFLRGYAFRRRLASELEARQRLAGLAPIQTSTEPSGPWMFDFYGFGECLPHRKLRRTRQRK